MKKIFEPFEISTIENREKKSPTFHFSFCINIHAFINYVLNLMFIVKPTLINPIGFACDLEYIQLFVDGCEISFEYLFIWNRLAEMFVDYIILIRGNFEMNTYNASVFY